MTPILLIALPDNKGFFTLLIIIITVIPDVLLKLNLSHVTSSNVIFDGAGYTIDGIYRWNSATQTAYGASVYGVSVNSYSTTSLTNITVKNLNVTEWRYGIYYYTTNIWDNGYPSGGNYWSDFNGSDNFSGLNQNLSGSDGIGDTLHMKDRYPLMSPYIGLTQAPAPMPMAVTGVLSRGVEYGCVILIGDDGSTYLLTGLSNNTPQFGSRVRVTAIRLFEVGSTCQQGELIKVVELALIAPPPIIKGDATGDGQVDILDLGDKFQLSLKSSFTRPHAPARYSLEWSDG